MPLLRIDSGSGQEDSCPVSFDHRQSAGVATEHLIELGHREIACVGGSPGLTVSVERLDGYRDALTAAGLPYRPELVELGDYTERGGYEATQALLDHPRRFTAIFAANDLMALGTLAACGRRGIDVPGAVSVVGLDDIGLAPYTSPALSTVRLPMRALGEIAAERLVGMIERLNQPPPPRKVLEGTLVVRDSTGRARGAPAG